MPVITHDLLLSEGHGAFFLNGSELDYDSSPVYPGNIPFGGIIDFSSRPLEQRRMLIDNGVDEDLVDPGDRTQVVTYNRNEDRATTNGLISYLIFDLPESVSAGEYTISLNGGYDPLTGFYDRSLFTTPSGTGYGYVYTDLDTDIPVTSIAFIGQTEFTDEGSVANSPGYYCVILGPSDPIPDNANDLEVNYVHDTVFSTGVDGNSPLLNGDRRLAVGSRVLSLGTPVPGSRLLLADGTSSGDYSQYSRVLYKLSLTSQEDASEPEPGSPRFNTLTMSKRAARGRFPLPVRR